MTNGITEIHFIGCGGAGMAPLALIMLQQGFKVTGSDIAKSLKTDYLAASGATVFHRHHPENLPANTGKCLVVYSSAIARDNPELRKALELGMPCVRRGEMLARLADRYKRPVAISGSHGKTTVTAMLVHILLESGINCGYLVGGKINGRDTSSAAGDGDIFITEVDESDGTNALVSPFIGLVTNVEDDHEWSVGGRERLFDNFARFAGRSANLVYFRNEFQEKLFAGHRNAIVLDSTTILSGNALLNEWGAYQCLNAAIAVQAATMLGIPEAEAESAVRTFPGVARRMMTHYSSDRLTVIEDYAHHPTEVAAALDTLRRRFPKHHLRIVFQPHRYARLERYINEFAAELAKADSVIIAPVFAAWAETGAVDSAALANLIGGKARALPLPWEKIAAEALQNTSDPLMLAVIGAGDIDRLIPLLIPNRR